MIGRRHFIVRVAGGDSPDQLALTGLAGRDDLTAVAVLENAPFGDVEPQVRFTSLGVGAVAIEASVRENRPDLSLEINGCWVNIGGSTFGVGAPIITTSRIPTIRSPLYLIFDDLIMVKAFVRSSETPCLHRLVAEPDRVNLTAVRIGRVRRHCRSLILEQLVHCWHGLFWLRRTSSPRFCCHMRAVAVRNGARTEITSRDSERR